MRPVLLTLAGVATLAIAGGVLVVGLGLYNVSARIGHLPGVSWILHTTFANSVELRAPGEAQVPALTDAMAAIGARHYDDGCRPCHAAPGVERTATMREMVPAPPHIVDAVDGWQPRHLFWIVANGVKMTGMPAWPAHRREDDVWLVVAFLERVGAMPADEYAALTRPPEDASGLVGFCAGCHGLDGAGRGNEKMPRLDILGAPYITASLEAYRAGLRQSGIMQQVASRLSDDEIEMLAGRFGAVRPATPPAAPPDAEVARGRELAFGSPDGDTPACRACHGPWPTRRSPLFPTLVGQRADYIAAQLRLWREGIRGGTGRAHLMHQVAQEIEQDDIDALAAFYAAGAPLE